MEKILKITDCTQCKYYQSNPIFTPSDIGGDMWVGSERLCHHDDSETTVCEGLSKCTLLDDWSELQHIKAEVDRLKEELLYRDVTWLPAKDAEIENLEKENAELKEKLRKYEDKWSGFQERLKGDNK